MVFVPRFSSRLLTALVVWIGHMFGGPNGAFGADLCRRDELFQLLVQRQDRAQNVPRQEIAANDDPELYGIVQELTVKAGLPMPKVYMIPEERPTLLPQGAIPTCGGCGDAGYQAHSQQTRATAVLGHELSHVKHRDILITPSPRLWPARSVI